MISFVAAIVAFRTNLGDRAYDPTPLPRLQWSPQLIGALVAASASGLVIGVYEACWSLLMHAHHASTLADPTQLDVLLSAVGRTQRHRRVARGPRQSPLHRAGRTR